MVKVKVCEEKNDDHEAIGLLKMTSIYYCLKGYGIE